MDAKGPDYEEEFAYLDLLRESGQINMFGAAPYLMEEFGLSEIDACEILVIWMKTFSQRNPND